MDSGWKIRYCLRTNHLAHAELPSLDRFMFLSPSKTVSAFPVRSKKSDHILLEILLYLLPCHQKFLEFWRQTAHAALELCGCLSSCVRTLPLAGLLRWRDVLQTPQQDEDDLLDSIQSKQLPAFLCRCLTFISCMHPYSGSSINL